MSGLEDEPQGIMDWNGTARRIRRIGVVVVVGVLVGWLTSGLLGDGLRLGALGDWVGLGLGVIVLSEIVVVGTAAVRAERRAAVRGERLSSGDVGLLPPRIRPATAPAQDAEESDVDPGQSERS